MEYEPVLVMTAVDMCIFDIKTEMWFKEFRRSQEKMTFTFVTCKAKKLLLRTIEADTKNSHAFNKVAKNAIIQEGVTWIKGKVQNMQHDRNPVSINAFTLESLHYDVPDLVSLQREDPDKQEVINYKSSTGAEKVVLPAAYKAHVQKLIVDEEDNLLKFCFHGGQCIVTPISLREEVLSLSHNQWTSGHFGIFKTHRRVLENFWWSGLHEMCVIL